MNESKLYAEMTEKVVELAKKYFADTGKDLGTEPETWDVLSLIASWGYGDFKIWFRPILHGRGTEVVKLPATKLVQITLEMFSPYELQEYLCRTGIEKIRDKFKFDTKEIYDNDPTT